MVEKTHSKIINDITKGILKPMGLIRKGQSRIWLDDNIWFTTVVEYQPSGWSKGTYLNIGINFNWHLSDSFSFDYGHRESGFIDYRNDGQFQRGVENLTNKGLAKVHEYRKFTDLEYAKTQILSYRFHSDDLWGNYHRTMICLMTGDKDDFLIYYNKLMSINSEIKWIQDLKDYIAQLLQIYNDNTLVIEFYTDLIKQTRDLKKLPVLEKDAIRQQITNFGNKPYSF